jgi:hypothetical protein
MYQHTYIPININTALRHGIARDSHELEDAMRPKFHILSIQGTHYTTSRDFHGLEPTKSIVGGRQPLDGAGIFPCI